MVHRAYGMCSTDHYIGIEIKYIGSCFNQLNGYSQYLKCTKKSKESNKINRISLKNLMWQKYRSFILVHMGLKGEHVINFKRELLNTNYLKKIKFKLALLIADYVFSAKLKVTPRKTMNMI